MQGLLLLPLMHWPFVSVCWSADDTDGTCLSAQYSADWVFDVTPQAPPCQLVSGDIPAEGNTVTEVSATCHILIAVLAADMQACEAVLRDGSWGAALQRVR